MNAVLSIKITHKFSRMENIFEAHTRMSHVHTHGEWGGGGEEIKGDFT